MIDCSNQQAGHKLSPNARGACIECCSLHCEPEPLRSNGSGASKDRVRIVPSEFDLLKVFSQFSIWKYRANSIKTNGVIFGMLWIGMNKIKSLCV